MNLRQVRRLIYALAAACLLMAALLGLTKSMVFFWLAMAFAAAIVVVNLQLWRCPYCGEHLGRDVSHYCTHCGKKLNDLG